MKTEKLLAIGLACMLLAIGFTNAVVGIEKDGLDDNPSSVEKSLGEGTLNDPIMINNVEELQNMSDDLEAHYELASDIDASETKTWNDGAGFEPIGDWDNRFTGVFDGAGYVISKLHINRTDDVDVGLFGVVGGPAGITNVGLEDMNITGNQRVGGLAGSNSWGSIQNSYAMGGVSGDWLVGGLVGDNYGELRYSYTVANVTGQGNLGGLVGRNSWDGVVTNSYATGSVEGNYDVGGLVGDNRGAVDHSYATGSVSATGNNIGGLVGRNSGSGIVSNCYATGSVNGFNEVGGLAGRNENIIEKSYSIGEVTGNEFVGGLVGMNMHMVEDSFWDMDTSGRSNSDGGEGKTTEEMMEIELFSDAGWDIVTVPDPDYRDTDYAWNIVDAETYPFLSWEESDLVEIYDWKDLHNVRENLTDIYFLKNDLTPDTDHYDEYAS